MKFACLTTLSTARPLPAGTRQAGSCLSVKGDFTVSGFGFAEAKLGTDTDEEWHCTTTTGMAPARLSTSCHGLGAEPYKRDHQRGRCLQRIQCLEERREAPERWGRFVEALVHPERARQNVVALRACRSFRCPAEPRAGHRERSKQ